MQINAMKGRHTRWLAGAFGLALAGTVHAAATAAADAASPGWNADAAAQLTHLEEETMLLKAQVKKLDAQAEVAQRTAALSRLGSSAAALDTVGQSVQVVAIEGVGRRYSAVIQTGDGQRFDVAAGDELPNGMRIVSIGANAVVGRWSNGETQRMIPVLASRSGAVFNPGTAGGAGMGSAGALNPGLGALVPVERSAPSGLPPGAPPATQVTP